MRKLHKGELLKIEIKDKGYSVKRICQKLGDMNVKTFNNRLKDGNFTYDQVVILEDNRYLEKTINN